MKNNAQVIRITLLVVFFLSGVSALIYQVIWVRMLGQIFGMTIFAVSTVLTAFMAGLALGSYLFGKLIDKRRDQLFIFLLLELGIGVFALLFPVLLGLMKNLYSSIAIGLHPHLYLSSILRFLFAFLLLLLPTILMGGTLPVLSKYYVRNMEQVGGTVGTLHAVNNLGAFCGAWLASFFLIRILGLSGNIYLAAGFNLALAGVIFLIRKGEPAPDAGADTGRSGSVRATVKYIDKSITTGAYPRPVLRLVLWAFAIEGFTTLVYEVVWTRILLGISCDKSVYFYATVIMAFIFGLSLGSFLASFFINRTKDAVRLLGILEIFIGLFACVLLLVFSGIAGYFSTARLHYTDPWLFSLGMEYFIFFLLMIGPATLMGMTFPVVTRLYTTNLMTLGKQLGVIGCLDTLGSIFGSFAAGFILIPFLGVVKAVLMAAGINVLLGLALVLVNPRSQIKFKIITVVAAIGLLFAFFTGLPQENYFRHWQTEEEGDRLLYYKEGLGSTIAVAQKFDGVKELAIDGAVTAIAEYGDIRVHKLLAYLPYLLCEKPDNALVVGFGMGITAQSLIQDDIRQVDCVEICKEIINGSARYFEKENKHVLAEPKLKVIIEDGRSYLAETDKKYSVITTNAVHPRLSINIYTQEFYESCRNHLSPDGVMCQWMTTNWLTETEYKMLLKSFTAVFSHTSLWVSNIGHVLLIGTPYPINIDYRQLAQKMNSAKIRDDLLPVHLDDPCALLSLYACGRETLDAYIGATPAVTDNYPLPEFSMYISTFPNLAVTEKLIEQREDVTALLVNRSGDIDTQGFKDYQAAERFFLRARHFSYLSNDKRVADSLEEAIRLHPRNFSFHHTLGDYYSSAAEFESAAIAYKQEIELGRDNPLGYINLAYAYLKLEKYDELMATAARILEIDPENGLGHYLLSIGYRLAKDFASGARELEAVLRYYPGYNSAYQELAEVYFALGRYRDAKTALTHYLSKGGERRNTGELERALRQQGE